MTRPTCHPDRPHYALGLCRPCWQHQDRRRKRVERLGGERPCAVCGDPFEPFRENSAYCSDGCREVASTRRQSERRGMDVEAEEFHATRSRSVAAALARGYVERGCRRVGARTARASVAAGAWVAAWHRGGGLYLIRARLPAEWREEAA